VFLGDCEAEGTVLIDGLKGVMFIFSDFISEGFPGLVSVILEVVFAGDFLAESTRPSTRTDKVFLLTKAAWAVINKKLNKMTSE
jgi:hypothetical protein